MLYIFKQAIGDLKAQERFNVKKSIIAISMVLAAMQVFAVQKGGLCTTISSAIRSTTTPLICPIIGEVTIDQIYEKGYRVIQVFQLDPKDSLSKLGVIIEEQSK